MEGHVFRWKAVADDIWFARIFRYLDAARLALDVAGRAGPGTLASLAKQAVPSLRAAAAAGTDAYRRSVARRRFGTMREELHALTSLGFGGRRGGAAGQAQPAEHQLERRLLGLPSGGALAEPDIQAAFKRMAKTAHPDRGGSTHAFTALVRARDVLTGRA